MRSFITAAILSSTAFVSTAIAQDNQPVLDGLRLTLFNQQLYRENQTEDDCSGYGYSAFDTSYARGGYSYDSIYNYGSSYDYSQPVCYSYYNGASREFWVSFTDTEYDSKRDVLVLRGKVDGYTDASFEAIQNPDWPANKFEINVSIPVRQQLVPGMTIGEETFSATIIVGASNFIGGYTGELVETDNLKHVVSGGIKVTPLLVCPNGCKG